MINVRRTVLRRLAAAASVIAVIVGVVVYYAETEQVDDYVAELAVAESQRIGGDALRLINTPGADLAGLQRTLDDFTKGHFFVIELYDRNRKRVIESVDPDDESLEEALKQQEHDFPIGDEVLYEKREIEGKLVLQIVLPIKDARGVVEGYFEGVYLIDAATLAQIRARILRTLGIALAVTLLTSLLLYPIILRLNRQVVRFSNEVLEGNIELMEVLGGAIAKRDSDTSIHNYRVTLYAIRLAEAAGMDKGGIRNLIAGAFLHDVGKIGISDNILLKPGRLTPEEFAVMRTHVTLGVDILRRSQWLQSARAVVEFHHEKFDGSGYMRGLKGEDIPLAARIFAVVDVFDALTSRRPYKEPMSCAAALEIIGRDAGTHFDPRLAELFSDIAPELHAAIAASGDEAIMARLDELVAHYFFSTFLGGGRIRRTRQSA